MSSYYDQQRATSIASLLVASDVKATRSDRKTEGRDKFFLEFRKETTKNVSQREGIGIISKKNMEFSKQIDFFVH